MQHWTRFVAERHQAGKRIAIWGSSSKGVSFLTTLGLSDEVGLVVDVNRYRQGMFMPGSGHKIVGPRELKNFRPDSVIVMNSIYLDEIAAELEQLHLQPELVSV